MSKHLSNAWDLYKSMLKKNGLDFNQIDNCELMYFLGALDVIHLIEAIEDKPVNDESAVKEMMAIYSQIQKRLTLISYGKSDFEDYIFSQISK